MSVRVPPRLGSLLEPSLGPRVPSWRPPGPSWGILGPFGGPLGGLFGCRVAIVGACGDVMEHR
eukprot:3001252-Pyramimonas_sp.AAC.1